MKKSLVMHDKALGGISLDRSPCSAYTKKKKIPLGEKYHGGFLSFFFFFHGLSDIVSTLTRNFHPYC